MFSFTRPIRGLGMSRGFVYTYRPVWEMFLSGNSTNCIAGERIINVMY